MGEAPFWHVVLPVARTNLLTNPSGERGTASWGTWIGGTVGTTSQYQAFGAWSGSVAPSSNGTAGILLGSITLGAGTVYGVSCYVRGANGIPYNLLISDNSGDNHQGSQTFTGGGTWHRYSFTYLESFGGPRKMTVRKQNSANTDAFYIDGAQLEVGSVTTHINGDEEGCYWLGLPHRSQSARSGTSRAGGSIVSLHSLGLIIDQFLGIGMPPLQNTFTSFAVQDGAEFQGQRAGERPFTLPSGFGGSTWTDYHATRRRILNALKIGAVSPQQPCRFYYTGAEGTVYIDAVLDGGMDGNPTEGFNENAPIRFIADDPCWYSPTDQGTSLAGQVNLGSTNFIAYRDPLGRWGTFGIAGTTFNTAPNVMMALPSGTLIFGGNIGSAGGTTAIGLAQYSLATGRFGTLTGGTVNGQIRALAYAPDGTVFLGGDQDTAGGTVARGVCTWNGAFGSLVGGTIQPAIGGDPFIFAMYYMSTGTLVFGGDLTRAGGTQVRYTAYHDRTAFGTLTNGTLSNFPSAIVEALDRSLYFTGIFTTAAGTTVNGVARHANGTWGSVGAGLSAVDGNTLAAMPNGRIVVGGGYTTAGGGTVNNISDWNGVQYFGLGRGLNGEVKIARATPDGDVLAAGLFTMAGSITLPDRMARYTGAAWLPFDVDFSSSSEIRDMTTFNGTFFVTGAFNGTANAASVTTIGNAGMSEAYPTLRMRNTSAGTVRVFQVVNTLTGMAVYFNLVLLAGEQVTLDTRPGSRTLQSDYRGNLFGQILPGSNLAAFCLLPSTNYVSFFADSTNIQADFYWRPRHESADGGTVF